MFFLKKNFFHQNIVISSIKLTHLTLLTLIIYYIQVPVNAQVVEYTYIV